MYLNSKIEALARQVNAAPEQLEGLALGLHGIAQATVKFSDLACSTVTGTYTFDADNHIPEGAIALQTHLDITEAFAGDTTAVGTLGDGSDVDRYNTGTPSFATAGRISAGAVSGTAYHSAGIAPKLTVTTATDASKLTAGSVTVTILYQNPLG
jgi:hypothetical protein